MVATVTVKQITGTNIGSATFTTKDTDDNTRYYTVDSYDTGSTAYPIPIPTEDGGVSGSYWVTHCLYTPDGPATYIKDIKWYTESVDSWSLGTGGGLFIGVSSNSIANARIYSQGFPSGSYDQGDGSEGNYGYFISAGTNGHTYYKDLATALSGGATDVSDFTSLENALMVHSGQAFGAAGTGYSNCIVTQLYVASGASQGSTGTKTCTFVYTEA